MAKQRSKEGKITGINEIDFSQLSSISDAAKTLSSDASPTIPSRAKGAIITVEDNNLRMRDDGTAPTASIGHLLYVGDVVTYDSWSVPKLNWRQVLQQTKFIQAVASTTGNLMISWYD